MVKDKEIEISEEDDFVPSYLPYERIIKHEDGTIEIINYD